MIDDNPSAFPLPLALTTVSRTKNLWQRLSASAFLRNNTILFVANLLTGACAYLYHPVVGRLLGEVGYSRVAALVSFSTILLIPVQIMIMVASKSASMLSAEGKIAELRGLWRYLSLWLMIVGAGVTGTLILSAAPIAAYLNLKSIAPIVILALLFIFAFVNALNLGTLQGLERFGWYSVLQLAGVLLRLLLMIPLVWLGLGTNGAIVALPLGTIPLFLLSVKILNVRFGAIQATAAPRLLGFLIRYSLLTTLAMGGTTLLTNLDIVLVKHFFLSETMAGSYAALATVGRIVLFISGSVTIFMFPRVSALHARGESSGRLLLQSLSSVLLISSCALLAFLIAPHLVVRILFPIFPSIAPFLFWYGVAMLQLALASTLIFYYLAVGKKMFIGPLAASCLLQYILISVWHHNIFAIVQDMNIVMVSLLLGLSVPLFLQLRHHRARRSLPNTSAYTST